MRIRFLIFLKIYFAELFSGRFDTSGSMLPCLVPEILIIYAFCDVVGVGVAGGIGDSRSWMKNVTAVRSNSRRRNVPRLDCTMSCYVFMFQLKSSSQSKAVCSNLTSCNVSGKTFHNLENVFRIYSRTWKLTCNIQLLESPIPAPAASQKASSINISGTKRGSIDPLVPKRPGIFNFFFKKTW